MGTPRVFRTVQFFLPQKMTVSMESLDEVYSNGVCDLY